MRLERPLTVSASDRVKPDALFVLRDDFGPDIFARILSISPRGEVQYTTTMDGSPKELILVSSSADVFIDDGWEFVGMNQ